MSIASFTSNKQGVQDLLAALPAPATPVSDRSRSDAFDQETKPGFNDLLRDSAQPQQATQRTESVEPVDAQPRAESQQDDSAASDTADPVDSDTSTQASDEGESQEASTDSSADKESGEVSADSGAAQQEDTSSEAQVQAAAAAASAQLNVVDAVQTGQPKAQALANTAQQLNLAQAVEAVSSDQASSQGQLSSAAALANGALPTQSQQASGPVVQAETTTTVQPLLQQGDSAQTNNGDKGAEGKSTATANATNAATSSNSNAAATAAFSVADQAGGESRLPVSTTATTPGVDATRVAQAQSAITSGDNDSLNTARLTRGLANAVQQRGGAVTLRLTPPEMGTVRIQMQITGTNVSASFHAESASAQTLLTTQLAQLRTALESKGMNVERLSVQPLAATAQSNNANQSQNQSDTQQQGQSQQQNAGDGRSRGQYSSDSSGQQSSDQQQDGTPGQQAPRGFFARLNDASEDDAA